MRLLEAALAPVEPPASLVDELEMRLASVSAAAIEALEELSEWELDAMRDPRNWVRPVAAVAVGTVAGTALVVLQLRRSKRQRSPGLKGIAEQGGRTLLGAVTPPAGACPIAAAKRPGPAGRPGRGPRGLPSFCYFRRVLNERRPSSKSRPTYGGPHEVGASSRPVCAAGA